MSTVSVASAIAVAVSAALSAASQSLRAAQDALRNVPTRNEVPAFALS
jgi:hypothetical protein